MKKIITRFAPSPTGKLHIGNIRTALINWLYAKKHGGEFILRMDDTDLVRSKDEYKNAILKDLQWLGITHDKKFNQLSRLKIYEQFKENLIASGRLYPCYETPEELEIKRKLQLSSGKPPIYDRSALELTPEQIAKYESQGRSPHYRFLINDEQIKWNDLIKGEIVYQGNKLSDPVIIRADNSMTYMLCSTVDDIEFNISHVIRGEDHISNTAIQIQMFEALGATPPIFSHLSLIKSKEDKISKRIGGFDIEILREKEQIEAMTINSFLTFIGSSKQMSVYKNMEDLVKNFNINNYSKSPTTYIPEELKILNHKLVINYEISEIQDYLNNVGLNTLNEQFWLAVRPNLQKLSDIKEWWKICYEPILTKTQHPEILSIAAKNLPQTINDLTWKEWTKIISAKTGKKGKELFLPLRLALTGKSSGPELQKLLPLLTREEILKRLHYCS